MQMFISFQPEDGIKSKEVLTYISHCLNAEIHEGTVGQQKGWVFIFKDELRPFNFGGKRKYTVDDEDSVAADIQNGKSLRQISRERNISPTTVRTLHKRYLSRNPVAYQFLTRDNLAGTDITASAGSLPETDTLPAEPAAPLSETETLHSESMESLPETDPPQPGHHVPTP